MMADMDLTEFLAARLDEDEAAAKACQSPSPWSPGTGLPGDSWIVTDDTGEPVVYDEGTPTVEEARHIARHDPARVLREVEAKRKILDRWAKSAADPRDIRLVAHADLEGNLALLWVVRQLAAVYSDHPDYDPAWR
jgi:hypothetical protein